MCSTSSVFTFCFVFTSEEQYKFNKFYFYLWHSEEQYLCPPPPPPPSRWQTSSWSWRFCRKKNKWKPEVEDDVENEEHFDEDVTDDWRLEVGGVAKCGHPENYKLQSLVILVNGHLGQLQIINYKAWSSWQITNYKLQGAFILASYKARSSWQIRNHK